MLAAARMAENRPIDAVITLLGVLTDEGIIERSLVTVLKMVIRLMTQRDTFVMASSESDALAKVLRMEDETSKTLIRLMGLLAAGDVTNGVMTLLDVLLPANFSFTPLIKSLVKICLAKASSGRGFALTEAEVEGPRPSCGPNPFGAGGGR